MQLWAWLRDAFASGKSTTIHAWHMHIAVYGQPIIITHLSLHVLMVHGRASYLAHAVLLMGGCVYRAMLAAH